MRFCTPLLTSLTLVLLAAAEDTAWDAHIEAGDALMTKGDYTGAKREFQLALSSLRVITQPGPLLWRTVNRLGTAHDVLGEYEEAERRYRQALVLAAQDVPVDRTAVALLRSNLASSFRLQGKYGPAREMCQRLLEELSQDPAHSRFALAHGLVTFGMTALDTGDLVTAEASLRRAVGLAKDLPTEFGNLAPQILHNLGILFQIQGKRDQALTTFTEACARIRSRVGDSHPDLFGPLTRIAILQTETGDYAAAFATFDAAISLGEKGLGRDHPLLAEVLERQARLLRKLNRKREARPLEARAKLIRRNHQRTDPARHTVNVKALARRQGGIQ